MKNLDLIEVLSAAMVRPALAFLLWIAVVSNAYPQTKILAFPGADGFGKYTSGGRGGTVFIVTNLNDSGPGSLREAVEAAGKRTVVFEVSGNIVLKSPLRVRNSDITIAGQTAPGDGITIQDFPLVMDSRNNIIVRYIRVRLGDQAGEQYDAMEAKYCKDVIIDHCSFSWGSDEVATFVGNENISVQWSYIVEGLNKSVHSKGDHGYGGILGGKNTSFHHNLIANNTQRSMRFDHPGVYRTPELLKSMRGVVDFRNNVIYNWRNVGTHGGEAGTFNMINNYYKPGPATLSNRIFLRAQNDIQNGVILHDYGKFYLSGNHFFENQSFTSDNWKGVVAQNGTSQDLTRMKINTPHPSDFYDQTHSSLEAYDYVLQFGGASFSQDEVDKRIITNVKEGTFSFLGSKGSINGIIDSQKDVGGWPELKSLPAPKDTDRDGMPDAWEIERGLNPNAYNPNGYNLDPNYTNLEVYLNSLVAHLIPGTDQTAVTGVSLTPTTLSLKVGESFNLVHQVLPTNAINKNVTWSSSQGTTASVSSSGVIQALAAGTSQIRVSTQDGNFSAICQLTVTPAAPAVPVLSSPVGGSNLAVGKTTFSWQPATNAERYRVQISRDAQFNSSTYDVLNLPATSVELDIKDAGSYFWRVSASNQAGSSAFSAASSFQAVAVPTIPQLAAPNNQSVDLGTNIVLSWSAVNSATSYRVQIATVRDFSTVLRDASNITANQLQVNDLEEGVTYFWRVRASNIAGNSSYSSIWEFSTRKALSVPIAPVLSSPANSSTLPKMPVRLFWLAVANADSYQIQVSLSSNFSQQILVNQTGLLETTFDFQELAYNTVYFWRVRARNGAGFGPYSSIRSFRTEMEPQLAAATLRSPAKNSIEESSTLEFAWSKVPEATHYTLYISQDSLFKSSQSVYRNISDTTLRLADLEREKAYFWRIEANGTKKSSISVVWRFSISQENVPEVFQYRNIGINLYPNPAKDFVNMSFSEFVSGILQIQLLDSRGISVQAAQFKDVGNSLQLDLSALRLPTGKYFLRIQGEWFAETKAVWID